MTAQALIALARANEVRCEASRQRKALVGAPAEEVVAALRNPSPELGRYKLNSLFNPKSGHVVSIVPGFGKERLRRVLLRLSCDSGFGRLHWHSQLRLDELTERERERLVEEIVSEAAPAWRAEVGPKGAGE